MSLRNFLVAALAASIAVPAAGAVTVIGSTSARLCFEAAENDHLPSVSSLRHCDAALEGDPLSEYDRVATLVNRGILKLRKGETGLAIADFDAAIARDPDEAEAYLNKGMATLRLPGASEEAVPLFDLALQKKTRRPAIAYYGRGVAHEMGGRVGAAYRDYRQASLIEPRWREPRTELARFSVRSARPN